MKSERRQTNTVICYNYPHNKAQEVNFWYIHYYADTMPTEEPTHQPPTVKPVSAVAAKLCKDPALLTETET